MSLSHAKVLDKHLQFSPVALLVISHFFLCSVLSYAHISYLYKEIPKFNGWETMVSFFLTLSGVSSPGWQLCLLLAGVSGTRLRVVVLQWSTGDFQNLLARREEEWKSGARGFHLSKWYGIRQIIFALVCWWSCGSNHITTQREGGLPVAPSQPVSRFTTATFTWKKGRTLFSFLVDS